MAVRIESEEATEHLHSDDRAGDGLLFRHGLLDEDFQGFPGTAAEIGKKFSVTKKVTTKDFREAEDKMPVGNLLEDIHAESFTEFNHAFLMAGRAEMAALA